MPSEENPTGLRYLSTFQALFQVIEIVLLLLVWALIASQKFLHIPGFIFAFGTFITVWFITLVFFTLYLFGGQDKINKSVGSENGNVESTGVVESSTKPPLETKRKFKKVFWFVAEYVIYFFCIVFLFIAVCIVTSKAYANVRFIGAYAIGWIALAVYILHFCLLVRNTEGKWPHQCIASCCGCLKRRKAEDSRELIPSTSADNN